MGTVKDVLEIIDTFSEAEKQQIIDYIQDDEWDKQIAKDAASGRLDAIFAKDIAEFEQGKCQKI